MDPLDFSTKAIPSIPDSAVSSPYSPSFIESLFSMAKILLPSQLTEEESRAKKPTSDQAHPLKSRIQKKPPNKESAAATSVLLSDSDRKFKSESLDSLSSKLAKVSHLKTTQIKKEQLKTSWQDSESKRDWEVLAMNKDAVISGFLDIGEKDGWKDGGQTIVGFHFTRYMLRQFWAKHERNFGDFTDIFVATIQSSSPSACKSMRFNLAPRAHFDTTVTGWDKHAVTRYVGNISKSYRHDGPFFEVLINSAASKGSDTCFPFSVSTYKNRTLLQTRYDTLLSLAKVPERFAAPIFYAKELVKPDDFLSTYKAKLGPNSTRILEALHYISLQRMPSQTVGNCWMKQAKRTILLSLYLEITTRRDELNYRQSWTLANKLYTRWEKSTIEEVEKLITQGSGYSMDLRRIAQVKIDQLLDR